MQKLNEIEVNYTPDYIQSLVNRRNSLVGVLGVQCEGLVVRSDSSLLDFRNRLAYIVQLDTEIQLINDFLETQPSDLLNSSESEVLND